MTRIEDVMDIYDDSLLWYNIPGYNGYQVSNTNVVRSMKHYKKYRFGILLKSNNGLYQLSNSQNQRVTISLKEILDLVNNDEHSKAYPYHTTQMGNGPRNEKCTIQRTNKISTETFAPRFTII